ncbi:MAG: YhgE/Pip domain-containing protein [Burkholderiales bacterium]|nr:YhgE/Pip domain-containing protein [Burkholderiales bacterium]
MPWIRATWKVALLEADLLRRFPRLRWSVLGIVLIPAFYAWIYLVSVWDPVSRTAALPAALVNLDQGTTVQGHAVNLGRDLAASLAARQSFGFYAEVDADAARKQVRKGKALFALIIPPDFSARAMGAAEAGSAKVVVFTSEGNNYTGAGFARRFGAELGHQLNETLNEKRWATVLGATAQSADKLAQLREGLAGLQKGAQQLREGLVRAGQGGKQLGQGTQQYATAVSALSDGVKQLAAGARQLEAARPPAAELAPLRSGGFQLVNGQQDLHKALQQLEAGAKRLVEGLGQLKGETEDIPFVGERIATAAAQLGDGANQLLRGLDAASTAQGQLLAGTQQYSKGVDKLADGVSAFGQGAAALAGKFPAEARLAELQAGGRRLVDASTQLRDGLQPLQAGIGQLALGLDTLAEALPKDVRGPAGTARGLATSVEPQFEIDAPVKTNGMGFAPNFIPVALWLGAVMTAFVFLLRRLPDAALGLPRVPLLLGKLLPLACINLAQAGVVLAMCAFVLELQAIHFMGLALVMAASSLTFMLLILALVRCFGDTGKAVALILLIVQLSAAGGMLPVELTSDFFRQVSPWLPFTWSVHGVRASAFGAFGDEWDRALLVLLAFSALFFWLAAWIGRWKFVPAHEHRPAMDV